MAGLDNVDEQIIQETLAAEKKKYESAEKRERSDKQKLIGLVVLFALIAAVCFVGALTVIFKWEPPPPQVVIVDSRTGVVTHIQPFEGEHSIGQREALIRSFTNQMVLARYNYSYSESSKVLNDQYTAASTFLIGKALSDFTQEVHASNPMSARQRFGEQGGADTHIKSINLLDKERVQVEFEVEQNEGGASVKSLYSYTGIGRFEWNNYEGLSEKEKRINALGFRFSEWNVTQNASNSAIRGRTTAE